MLFIYIIISVLVVTIMLYKYFTKGHIVLFSSVIGELIMKMMLRLDIVDGNRTRKLIIH